MLLFLVYTKVITFCAFYSYQNKGGKICHLVNREDCIVWLHNHLRNLKIFLTFENKKVIQVCLKSDQVFSKFDIVCNSF